MKAKTAPLRMVTMFLFLVVSGLVLTDLVSANFSPASSLLSPRNKTYTTDSVPLSLESKVPAYLWEGWYYSLNLTVTEVCYSLDGNANQSVEFTFSTKGEAPNREAIYKVDTTIEGLSDGLHNITVYLKDEDYVVSAPFEKFTVDTTGPDIEFLSPENETYYTRDIPVNITTNENVAWIIYNIDGYKNLTTAKSIMMNNLSEGIHKVTVHGEDLFGNKGTPETVTFTISNEPKPEHVSEQPEPFPATLIASVGAVTAVTAVCFVVYYKKYKK
ncbi:MAG: hypothetical protein NWF03_02350 [Candidatus Bathyarchaeota archaeon]|nr:hypothetical protein [Candidatus Bathyarchaeota archaeon]